MANKKKQDFKKLTEYRLREWMKCQKSFQYFIRNYIFLSLPGGDVKITPYEKQLELLQLVEDHHFAIVLKSRQIGISTITQAYVCWLVIFYKNAVVGVVSKNGDAATKFSRFIAGFIDKLPKWMNPGFDKRNERSFELLNGSKCYNTPVDPKNPGNCLRGEAITFLILDEAAFTQKLEEAWTSIVPALATSQKHAKAAGVPYGTIILSTPNKTTGMGKFFYSRYLKAISGEGRLKPFIIHWKMIKELAKDPDWYSTQCELFDNDPRRIQQELELKFLPTEGSFFDDKTNTILQDNPGDPIEIQKIFNGEIRVYQRPISGRHYLTGVDTATENGEDKSTIVIFDYITMEQVWEYQAKCAVTDFCKIVKVACATYPGTIVIENNSVGNQVMETMDRSNYHMMLYKEKRKNRKGQITDIVPGLCMDRQSRPLVIDSLYSYVTNYPNMIKSKNLALELIGLVTKKSGKVEADEGCHDDLAMAASMCYYVRKYDPPVMISNKNSEDYIDLKNIMGMNDIYVEDMDNASIMKHIKNKMSNSDMVKQEDFSFIDIMQFYEE